MDQTHVHLLINHVPVIGSVFGAFVLAYGLWSKSISTKIAAYHLLIFSSIGAVISYLTGEAAEETVENIQGISKEMVEQHEDLAVYAFGAFLVLGVAAVVALVITLKRFLMSRTAAWSVLLIAIISFVLVARTAYLGGQIRHTEINAPAAVPGPDSHEDD